MSWSNFPTTLTTEQIATLVDESARSLGGLSLATLRDRQALAQAAEQAVRSSARTLGLPLPPAHQLQAVQAQVLAKVGGLGFLDALLPRPALPIQTCCSTATVRSGDDARGPCVLSSWTCILP